MPAAGVASSASPSANTLPGRHVHRAGGGGQQQQQHFDLSNGNLAFNNNNVGVGVGQPLPPPPLLLPAATTKNVEDLYAKVLLAIYIFSPF